MREITQGSELECGWMGWCWPSQPERTEKPLRGGGLLEVLREGVSGEGTAGGRGYEVRAVG